MHTRRAEMLRRGQCASTVDASQVRADQLCKNSQVAADRKSRCVIVSSPPFRECPAATFPPMERLPKLPATRGEPGWWREPCTPPWDCRGTAFWGRAAKSSCAGIPRSISGFASKWKELHSEDGASTCAYMSSSSRGREKRAQRRERGERPQRALRKDLPRERRGEEALQKALIAEDAKGTRRSQRKKSTGS
jgi:hypothetical protein